MTLATATLVSTIISTLATIGISLGSLGYTEAQAADLTKKINEQKVSVADITNLISKISDKATVLGSSKLNTFKDKLSRILNHYSISSGESEAVLRPIRVRLEQLNAKLSKLKTSAELHSQNAEVSMNAFNALSDKEKAKTYKRNPEYDEWARLYAKPFKNDKDKARLKELNAKMKNNEIQKYTGDFQDSTAGRTMKQVVDESTAAASDYSQIAKLSEENM